MDQDGILQAKTLKNYSEINFESSTEDSSLLCKLIMESTSKPWMPYCVNRNSSFPTWNLSLTVCLTRFPLMTRFSPLYQSITSFLIGQFLPKSGYDDLLLGFIFVFLLTFYSGVSQMQSLMFSYIFIFLTILKLSTDQRLFWHTTLMNVRRKASV